MKFTQITTLLRWLRRIANGYKRDASILREMEIVRDYFCGEYYLRINEDVAATGADPLEHYCRYGWREMRDPSPSFSTRYYLSSNPDVREAARNPFVHYILEGKKRGLNGGRERMERLGIETGIESLRPHFDETYYRYKYPDIAHADVDLLEHYWIIGWKVGRDPCATFSTSYYLDTNPDIVSRGVNPFWHYVVAGKSEGRSPQHPGGYRVERLKHLKSLALEALHWRVRPVPDKLLGANELATILSASTSDTTPALLISIGHDQYRKISGGVQFCEHREEVITEMKGHAYLHLRPWQPLPWLARPQEDRDFLVSLLLNGVDIGQTRMADVISAVKLVRVHFADIETVVHHLIGHSPEHIESLIRASDKNNCWLWLHDFFTLCPSYTLQRNGVSYCGAPPLESNSCEHCNYGAERRSHTDRMKSYFSAIQVNVLSPSQFAADFWLSRAELEIESLRVLPHMTLSWRRRSTPYLPPPKLTTVAFLGYPAPHKGWSVFEQLFREFKSEPSFRFLYLGASLPPVEGIEHEHVHVTADNPNAMIHAVRNQQVDVVLHWAVWPETFSLATHEALAGGAFVLTNLLSGNVAGAVNELGRGVVFKDEAELMGFFRSGKISDLVKTARAKRRGCEADVRFSRMVHDAFDQSVTVEI